MTPLAYGAAIALAIGRAVEPEEVERLVGSFADLRDGERVEMPIEPPERRMGRDGRGRKETRAERSFAAEMVVDVVIIGVCAVLLVGAAMGLAWWM